MTSRSGGLVICVDSFSSALRVWTGGFWIVEFARVQTRMGRWIACLGRAWRRRDIVVCANAKTPDAARIWHPPADTATDRNSELYQTNLKICITSMYLQFQIIFMAKRSGKKGWEIDVSLSCP